MPAEQSPQISIRNLNQQIRAVAIALKKIGASKRGRRREERMDGMAVISAFSSIFFEIFLERESLKTNSESILNSE
jgi:hypothetical protein